MRPAVYEIPRIQPQLRQLTPQESTKPDAVNRWGYPVPALLSLARLGRPDNAWRDQCVCTRASMVHDHALILGEIAADVGKS